MKKSRDMPGASFAVSMLGVGAVCSMLGCVFHVGLCVHQMNILPVSSAEGGDRFFVQAAVWKSEYGAELLWLLANATDQPEVERRAAGAMLPSWRVWCFLFFGLVRRAAPRPTSVSVLQALGK